MEFICKILLNIIDWQIDRILAETDFLDPFSKEKAHWFLVKWQSTQYDQTSWESETDLSQLYEDSEELEEKISTFRRFNTQPQKRDPHFYDTFLSIGERPPLKYWSKLDSSARWKDDNSLRDYQLEGNTYWVLFS